MLIATLQAVVRGLIRDENDNAGAVNVMEAVKATARATGIPWLIDAHSGKGEDQSDDADPTRAMRGASGAAGSADFLLSLRYASGPFASRRRLSAKGRFVHCPTTVIEFDDSTRVYSIVAGINKDATADTTWRLIRECGALTAEPQGIDAIAKTAGLVGANGKVTTTQRRQVTAALFRRDGVRMSSEIRRGQETKLFALLDEANA